VTAEDLVNLGKYNIYLKLMFKGIAGRPFSAETLPLFEKPKSDHKNKIIKISRERYGVNRIIVEDKVRRWTGFTDEEIVKPQPRPKGQGKSTPLYNAQCSSCGKKTKVIFPPDGIRPIYCKSCLKKMEQEKGETISLADTKKRATVSFSPLRKTERKTKRVKKKVNIEELKKSLDKALGKDK